jgi:hypothetical protein
MSELASFFRVLAPKRASALPAFARSPGVGRSLAAIAREAKISYCRLQLNRRPERGSLSLVVYDFIAKIYPESDYDFTIYLQSISVYFWADKVKVLIPPPRTC